MARALKNGATPYRDRDGKWRHIPFKEANLAAVEPWVLSQLAGPLFFKPH